MESSGRIRDIYIQSQNLLVGHIDLRYSIKRSTAASILELWHIHQRDVKEAVYLSAVFTHVELIAFRI